MRVGLYYVCMHWTVCVPCRVDVAMCSECVLCVGGCAVFVCEYDVCASLCTVFVYELRVCVY